MNQPRVAIIGAGMSGVAMAIALKRAAVDAVTLYEKGDAVGGTWRVNRYPGVACDVPSLYYSYSFAPNPDWSHVFAGGAEIRRYFERVVDTHDVRRHLRLGCGVRSARWDGAQWEIELDDESTVHADFLIAATGVVHRVNKPAIEGLESFAGDAFHSAEWDDDVALDGRRVGLVGTGSTGVQITCALGGRAKPLTVFMRTPQWVMPIRNPPVSPRVRAALRRSPRLRRAAYATGRAVFESLIEAVLRPGLRRRWISAMCRRNLARVSDPRLRARLTPPDVPMCRRLILAEGYYETLQRDDVHVASGAIERVEPAGVRTTDGVLHELDVLVLATGFDPHAFMRPIEITGLDGRTLADEWSGGARGYRSVALPGSPNLFTLLGPHSPFGNQSQIMVAETQVAYAMRWIERWRRTPMAAVPTDAAAERFNADVRDALRVPGTVWTTGCKSWYLGADGLPELWPWEPSRHREMLAEVRDEDWAILPV